MDKIISKLPKFPKIDIVKQLDKFPFIKKAVRFYATASDLQKITKNFVQAYDSRLPIGKRIAAAARGTCCSLNYVAKLLARRIPNPVVASIVESCCYLLDGVYSAIGGDK